MFQLTSIRQEYVDQASDYSTLLAIFRECIYRHDVAAWGSWGNCEYRQFEYDCGYHRQSWPFGFEHMNFKEALTGRYHLAKRGDSRPIAGLSFIGINHRGLDDARNIEASPCQLRTRAACVRDAQTVNSALE